MNCSNPMVASSVEPKVNKYDTNLMNNYNKMVALTDPFIKRSYECGKWYQVVCNPFDRQYTRYKKWYESDKFISSVESSLRKYCKKDDNNCTDMFLVKERMNCKKHHVNVLVNSKFDLSTLHGKNNNKFKYYCVELYTLDDRRNIRDYMIKESKTRNLLLKEDYDYTFDSELVPDYIDVDFLDKWLEALSRTQLGEQSERTLS